MNTNKVKKIMKLSTTWCAPCRVYASTFHKVKEMDEYSVQAFQGEEHLEGEDFTLRLINYVIREIKKII